MPKLKVRAWNLRVRRVLVVALVAPFFTAITVVSPQTAFATPPVASDGSCSQVVGNSTGITVIRVGNDCVITFTNTTQTTWQVPAHVFNLRYLVVGGGASGDRGVCGVHYGHGGGGGQALDSILQVTPSEQLNVRVGRGGVASGNCYTRPATVTTGNPGDSSAFGNITANGGSRSENTTSLGGKSGAGFAGSSPAEENPVIFPAGGGGGAAGPANLFDGGPGLNSNITGPPIMYGSGGAGRRLIGTTPVYGTASPGGATGLTPLANRGGGGSDSSDGVSTSGGNGVIVIRYTAFQRTITLDKNTNSATSALIPDRIGVFESPTANKLPVAEGLGKGNFIFGGWNTAPNGSGISYPGTNSSLADLGGTIPFLRLEATNFDAATKTWTATNGASILVGNVQGNPTSRIVRAGTAGASETFTVVRGESFDGLRITTSFLDDYTFCAVARIPTATTEGSTLAGGRLFSSYGSINASSSTPSNWLSGWWAGYQNRFYHEQWIVQSTTPNDTNFHLICDRNDSVRWDGVQTGTRVTGASFNLPQLAINWSNHASEASSWEVAEILIYNSRLTEGQVATVEGYLKNRYGVAGGGTGTSASNYQTSSNATLYAQWNSRITYLNDQAGSGTVPAPQIIPQAGAPLAGNTGNLTAPGKTLIGWNTQEAGGTRYRFGETYTPVSGSASLYAEWVDSLTLRNSANGTSTTAAIGAGVGGRVETITAANGFGARVFTLSPGRPGFSIDTSTANGVALVVSPVVASGTYLETLTARDATGFTVNHVVTVTVNQSTRFDTSTATTVVTTHRRGATLRLNTLFGVGTKLFTMTPAGTGITLDTSTAAASGFATLRVDTFTAVGTYTQVITVTDDTKIRSTYTVTITINGPPTISSTSAITTTPVTSGLRLSLDAGDPASYSGSGNTWTDLSGNGNNATWQVSPTWDSATGGIFNLNGTSQYATARTVKSDVFTVEAWARFTTLPNTHACLVVDEHLSTPINYAICFWQNGKILGGYWTSGTNWITTGEFTPQTNTWYQFIYTVSKVNLNYIGSLYVNGTLVTGISSNPTAPTSSERATRIGLRWDGTTQIINGSIPVVRIYNRALSTTEIAQNYTAVLPRFTNNPTNSVTISTTESVTASSSIYYAGLGTGNKTFALSNPTTGISIETSTVNTVRLNVGANVPSTSTTVARSISQIITATDTNGVAAATPVYVTTVINPKVIVTDLTPGNLTTTFGRIALDTFTATQGTGTKTFTVTSASFASAFAMTNPSANTGLLTVANTLPAGTYLITITATDAVGAVTTLALSVVVNPVPTIAGATGNTLTTTLARTASLRINVLGGTGARTITWTSPHAGITIESSTITSQNFITLSVSAAVPARTYSFAITAVDSTSARVSDTFTVVVNRWPVIGTGGVVTDGLRVNLDASTYSGSGNWLDTSGFGRDASGGTASTVPVGTTPTYSTESGGIFSFNEGTATTNHMLIPNPGSFETFTVSTWIRLKSIPTNNTAIIGQYWPGGSNTLNYVVAFSGSSIYGAYYRGANGWTVTSSLFTPAINTWYQVTYLVFKSGNNYFQDLYINGVKQGSSVDAGVIAPASNGSVISLGRRWDYDLTLVINGAYGNVAIYNRALTAAEVLQNYNATGSRFVSTNSGRETLTVTQGVAGSLSGVTASQGTGTKMLTLSNTNPGITIDTSTTNTFSLALANTLTATSTTVARTLTETVTATDTAGAITSRVYSVVVNPPIRIESTTSTITTTSGILAFDTFTATFGTGDKTFALTGTPSTAGFTLTQANNRAVLRVDTTANPGTYNLVITATDSVGATTTLTKTVIVNARPTISGSSNFSGTTGYAFSTPSYTASNGTGALTFSITTVPATVGRSTTGITLSATTGSPTINVSTGVLPDTYTVTLRATDSLTAFGTFLITLRINETVTISGTRTLTKVYGEDFSQVFATSGGSAPFNIFSSTICTSEKSNYTDGGITYTVETFNGIGACTWAVPTGISNVSVLTVAGGGGGGGTAWAGGGGAGGVVFAETVSLVAGAAVPIIVGGGGAGGLNNDSCVSGSSPSQGSNGNNSAFNSTFTAVGGGGGGGYGWSNRVGCGSGKSGGSGGGAGETDYLPTRASSTQGSFAGALSYGNGGGVTVFTGGIQAGSGGGGAGGIGASTANSRNHVAGNGGIGILNAITGTSTFYGGGGGGATCISGCTAGAKVGVGGSGGGGDGGHGGANPGNGTNGRGGGGGGSQTGIGGAGGSGTVIVRYVTPIVDTQTTRLTMDTLATTPAGLIRLNAPRLLSVQTYTQTITVRDSAATPATTSATITLVVSKATPTLTLALPGSVTTAKYGNPVTISAVATTPGTVAFVNGSSNITACTAVATIAGLATCSFTPTVVGATTLRATLTPTDTANFNSSAQVNLAITVAKADTLTVTVTSLARQFTGSTVAVTAAFTTTGLVAIDSLTAISMLYAGNANSAIAYSNTTAPTNAGTYSITPNFPANASAYTFVAGSLGTTSSLSNYESVTVIAGTLTINRAPQVLSFTYPNSNTATYSPMGTITASATTRLDSAARQFSSTTLAKCTIDSTTAVISIVEAGSCQVNMAVAQTFNYLAETASATVTINKASRTFSLTPAVPTLKFAESTTVTATLSGGALDGAISYILGSPAGCDFDPLSAALTATSGTVQCPLRATIAEGLNYLAETTTAISLTIARANAPLIRIDTVTAMSHTPGLRALITPTFSVTGLKNLDTASSLTFTYSFISNPFETFTYSDTRTPIDAATYRITPSALTLSTGLLSNYETPTYASSAIDFIINRINQESVTIENTNGEIEVPFVMMASGGNTNGALTFTKISGDGCSVSGSQLIATQAGACVLTVTMAGNRNYLAVTSESVTVRVRNFVVVVVEVPSNPVTGITIAPSVPIVKGPDICLTGCVPKIITTDVFEGAEATLVLITGLSFDGVTKVYFNIYTEAPNFLIVSDTQISVRVPTGLPLGDATIEVTSPGGTSNRYWDFFILP